MKDLVIASVSLYVLSIISFFIKNGNHLLTLKQIVALGEMSNFKKPYFFKNYPDILLMFSIVSLIIYFNYPIVIEIIGGVMVIFTQKILILIFQYLLPKSKN
jgi:hypothetical protein